MTEYHISLPDVESVKRFVNAVTRFDCDIDIVSDRYVVDAKSIIGRHIFRKSSAVRRGKYGLPRIL